MMVVKSSSEEVTFIKYRGWSGEERTVAGVGGEEKHYRQREQYMQRP